MRMIDLHIDDMGRICVSYNTRRRGTRPYVLIAYNKATGNIVIHDPDQTYYRRYNPTEFGYDWVLMPEHADVSYDMHRLCNNRVVACIKKKR